MSDALTETALLELSTEKVNNITPAMRDFMVSRLGLQESDISGITVDREFSIQIDNLMQNPENQTERMVFLGKYIYDRIIVEAQKTGKDPLEVAQSKGKDDTFIFNLDAYINKQNKQAVIIKRQEGKQLDDENNGKRQEGKQLDDENNGKRQELIKTNEKVKEYAESAKDALSIQGQEELSSQIEEAKKDENFIKKLEEKGYKKEDIQSGKYNDTLTGYILAEKGAEFVAKGYIQDLEKFQSAVKNITDILGIPRPLPKIDDIPIAKGPRRDRIISEGTKLVESGKYHENGITYNPETGRIRFEPKNPTASAAEIDTSRIPPRLEYVRNGLRIGRDIETVPKEEQERKEKAEVFSEKARATEKSDLGYRDFITSDKYKKGYEKLFEKPEIKKLQEEKENLSREYLALTDLGKKEEYIVQMLARVEDMNKERKKTPDLFTNIDLENALEEESFILKNIQRNLAIQLQAKKDIPTGRPVEKRDNSFESTAEYNLNFLTYIGYDTLGQENMERVIRTLNSPENPKRSEIGEIHLNEKLDTLKTQALTLAIANLVRAGRKETIQTAPTEKDMKNEASQQSWDDVDKTDPIIAARQTQSFGFRESLLKIKRNMMNEGGSLKTDADIKGALF